MLRELESIKYWVQRLSKFGPLTGSISLTWEFVRNANSQAPLWSLESETLGMVPRVHSFNNPPGDSDAYSSLRKLLQQNFTLSASWERGNSHPGNLSVYHRVSIQTGNSSISLCLSFLTIKWKQNIFPNFEAWSDKYLWQSWECAFLTSFYREGDFGSQLMNTEIHTHVGIDTMPPSGYQLMTGSIEASKTEPS